MWYRFEDSESVGKLDVKHVQVVWYDMDRGGACFDEDWILPGETGRETLEKIGRILPYVETGDETNKMDRSRVFITFGNGDQYELMLRKLTPEQSRACCDFDGGR